jgi:cell division transport system permease protein
MKRPLFKVQTISVYISTTLVLLLLGVMGVLFIFGENFSRSIQQNLTVSVIIDSKANDMEILKIQKEIGKKKYVSKYTYISKEQALEEEMEALKTNPLEQLGYNPYEASIEITMSPEYSNSDSLATIEKELLENRLVTEVLYQKELMDSVNSNLHKAGLFIMVFLIMLTLISWSLIGNLVRLSIYSKRFILHTMKLVGATWSFIRRPFIIKNLWIGLLSGVIANTILAIGLYTILMGQPQLAEFLPIGSLMIVAVTVIVFGVAICSLCAYLSVNKFLRMRRNDLYFM